MDVPEQDRARSTRSAPTRSGYEGIETKFGEAYNESWFAKEDADSRYEVIDAKGYQAPPLDGIWATAPYLHNGSVPTLYGVLNSDARPKLFTRSFRTGEEDYDPVKVGWKCTEVTDAAGREDCPRTSSARSTTRRSPAAATRATPSATT